MMYAKMTIMTTHTHLGTLSKRLFILFLPCFNLRGAQGILDPYRLRCTRIAECEPGGSGGNQGVIEDASGMTISRLLRELAFVGGAASTLLVPAPPSVASPPPAGSLMDRVRSADVMCSCRPLNPTACAVRALNQLPGPGAKQRNPFV